MEKRIFIKRLTPAEVGDTGTHEKYIRLPNDFDYENFDIKLVQQELKNYVHSQGRHYLLNKLCHHLLYFYLIFTKIKHTN